MTWRLHGGLPLVANDNIGIDDECCCQDACVMPCAPYTSFDVALTVDGDVLTWETPACYVATGGDMEVRNDRAYCWLFPTPPPLVFRFGVTYRRLTWSIVRVQRQLSGVSGLAFSVNLPLTSAPESGCCKFIPTGSPSDINGSTKRFSLTELTLTETYTIRNGHEPTELATYTVTTLIDAEVWLGAGCFASGVPGIVKGVSGYGKFIITSSEISVPDICNCDNQGFNQTGCVGRPRTVGSDLAGCLAGTQNHALIEIYSSLLTEVDTADWCKMFTPDKRTGDECVQGLFEGALELDRLVLCSGIPWPGPQTQLIRGNAIPFSLTVEGAP
jgi:hypothetical protein